MCYTNFHTNLNDKFMLPNENLNIKKVISELEKFDGQYKREQVTYALEHQEEITPRLINILRNVAAEPLIYVQREDYFGHIYALILLSFFKEVKAHKPIIDLFSIPEHFIQELFGDVASEDLSGALYQTCGGSLKSIKQLAVNDKVPDSTRNAAIRALLYAVIDGLASREDVLNCLSTLFTGNETGKPSDFWSFIACDICDLCPNASSYEVIKKAYSEGLIDEGIVGFDEFEKAIEIGVEESLNSIRRDKRISLPDNVHDMMSWWACFEETNYVNIHAGSTQIQRKSKQAKKKTKRKTKKKNIIHRRKKKKRKK